MPGLQKFVFDAPEAAVKAFLARAPQDKELLETLLSLEAQKGAGVKGCAQKLWPRLQAELKGQERKKSLHASAQAAGEAAKLLEAQRDAGAKTCNRTVTCNLRATPSPRVGRANSFALLGATHGPPLAVSVDRLGDEGPRLPRGAWAPRGESGSIHLRRAPTQRATTTGVLTSHAREAPRWRRPRRRAVPIAPKRSRRRRPDSGPGGR